MSDQHKDNSIQIMENGPLIVMNCQTFTNSKGETIEVKEKMALCRCGASEKKPFCDGAHKRVGFQDGEN